MALSSTDITALVRPLLNDSGAAIYTDTVLAPFLSMAWDQLANELGTHGVDVVKSIAGSAGNTRATAIPVAAGTAQATKIDPFNDATYSYLTDLIYPVRIQEKAAGTTDDNYTTIVRKDWDDNQPLTTDIRYWTWRKGVILLRTPTSNREIRIEYISSFGDLALTTPVSIWYEPSKSFLVYQTAALAALFIGENQSRAQSLDSQAGDSLDQIVRMVVKSTQNMPARRKPFSSFRTRRLI